MAAPAVLDKLGIRFRDAKGNTAKMTVKIGDADHATTVADLNTLVGHLAAASNAHVQSGLDTTNNFTYGTNAEFPNVEDKAVLTFKDASGGLHRFAIPAPKLAIFDTDGETIKPSVTAIANVITDFQTFVYASNTATSALVYVGGFRQRRKLHRKITIFTLDPTLTESEE